MLYLDPKSDFTFKKVFGEHPHLLISFLNAMLPFDEDRYIETIEYLPTEMVPENPLLKNSMVDVRCKDNRGRQFIVEMQMHWTTAFMQRVLFNASKAYVRQLDKPFWYDKLEPVYSLCLVNDIFQPDKDDYYHHYKIVNIADTEQRIEGLEFIFIELPKFRAKNITEKKLQVLWLRFLTEIGEKTTETPADLLVNSEIREALELMKCAAFSNAELEAYDKVWDIIGTEITLQAGAYKKGKTEGIQEGEKIGIEKGRAEGELLKAYKTALKGIKRKLSVQDIIELTELPEDKILKLFALYQKHKNNANKFLDEMDDDQ